MIILGIDPGIARVGWAFVEYKKGLLSALAYGCIETPKTDKTPLRLLTIDQKLSEYIHLHKPDTAAIEELFFSKNVKTAITVGEARGVALLTCARAGIPVLSYSPSTIKRTTTGDGNADKKQVERMVMMTLHLKKAPTPDDTVDALAIAMTHAYTFKMQSL